MSAESEATAHEEGFVNAFIERDRRERLLFELDKRRGHFLGRFCHDALTYLDPRYVTALKPRNSDPAQIFEFLRSRGAGETCYAISTREDLDGQFLPLAEAIAAAVGFGMPSILSCLPGQLAYLETEQEAGPPDRFLLSRPALSPQ
jgi:hypothetical protein